MFWPNLISSIDRAPRKSAIAARASRAVPALRRIVATSTIGSIAYDGTRYDARRTARGDARGQPSAPRRLADVPPRSRPAQPTAGRGAAGGAGDVARRVRRARPARRDPRPAPA